MAMEPIIETAIEEELISSVVGIMSVTVVAEIAQAVIPKTINYRVENADWNSPMPLFPGKEFLYHFRIRNLSAKNTFRAETYIGDQPTGHVFSSAVGHKQSLICEGIVIMPFMEGAYPFTVKVTVGNVSKTYIVSSVYVAKFSVEDITWSTGGPADWTEPPDRRAEMPFRPGKKYVLEFYLRNNDNIEHEIVTRVYDLVGDGRLVDTSTYQPGQRHKIIRTYTVPDIPGTYSANIDVYLVKWIPFRMTVADVVVAWPIAEFEFGQISWNEPQPFNLNTLYNYEFSLSNLGEVGATFSVELYLDDDYVATHSAVIGIGGSATFNGSVLTPSTEFGRSYLLARVVVNGFAEWYSLSNIDLGKVPAINGIGDLNDDGYVSYADIDILKLYICGYDIGDISPLSEVEFMRRADVNGDGIVNIGDSIAIRRLVYGI